MRIAFIALLIGLSASAAHAQSSNTFDFKSETGFNYGSWTAFQSEELIGRLAGVRRTRNLNSVIAAEVSLDGSWESEIAAVVGNIRVISPDDMPGPRWFATAGLVTGSGLGYTWSPMYGFGMQTEWIGPVAVRLEWQLFPRGMRTERFDDDGRLQFGVVFGRR